MQLRRTCRHIFIIPANGFTLLQWSKGRFNVPRNAVKHLKGQHAPIRSVKLTTPRLQILSYSPCVLHGPTRLPLASINAPHLVWDAERFTIMLMLTHRSECMMLSACWCRSEWRSGPLTGGHGPPQQQRGGRSPFATTSRNCDCMSRLWIGTKVTWRKNDDHCNCWGTRKRRFGFGDDTGRNMHFCRGGTCGAHTMWIFLHPTQRGRDKEDLMWLDENWSERLGRGRMQASEQGCRR